MSQPTFHTVVFTDLDGTLLDDHYDLTSAAYMLNELSHRGVLTVPASSKTKAELDAFSGLLSFDPPLISENGAGIVWPQAWQPVLETSMHSRACVSYTAICAVLADLKARHAFQFAGFADMSLDEICQLTGLDSAAAALARQRIASEPISWADSPQRLADFRALLAQQGLTLIEGGRFFHVMGPSDKGQAARSILDLLRERFGQRPLVLACGDSPNDLCMLRIADGCVLFPGRDGAHLELDKRFCVRAQAPGALTWLEGVNQLMNRLQNSSGESRSNHR